MVAQFPAYHLLNEKIKKILLSNFRTLNNYLKTRRIFTDASFVAYRGDRNIRNGLVRTTVDSQSADPAGTFLATIQDAALVNMLAPE